MTCASPCAAQLQETQLYISIGSYTQQASNVGRGSNGFHVPSTSKESSSNDNELKAKCVYFLKQTAITYVNLRVFFIFIFYFIIIFYFFFFFFHFK